MLRYYLLIPFFVRLRPRSFFDLSNITPKMENTTQLDTDWDEMIKKFGLSDSS
jgi:hypothetical protein